MVLCQYHWVIENRNFQEEIVFLKHYKAQSYNLHSRTQFLDPYRYYILNVNFGTFSARKLIPPLEMSYIAAMEITEHCPFL